MAHFIPMTVKELARLLPGKNKHRNRKVHAYGRTWHSEKEKKRYEELLCLQSAGLIRNLQVQVPYTFSVDERFITIRSEGYPNGRKLRYVADFTYDELVGQAWRPVVEDVKGQRLPVYKIKKALMEFFHGVVVREV